MSISPGPDWFTLSLEHYGEHKFANALLCIDQYMQKIPEDEQGKIIKAMILTALSNLTEAEKVLKSVNLEDQADRFLAIYYSELGNMYAAKPDAEKATAAYDKVIELEPNRTNGLVLKGAVLAQTGHYEAAIPLYLKATELEGDPDEAWVNLGLIYRAELKLEEAAHAFAMALSITPEYEDAITALEDVKEALELKMML